MMARSRMRCEDIRALAIEDRKARLAGIAKARSKTGIILSEHLAGNGSTIFEYACKLGLEGTVSKKLGSKYKSGRCLSWVKVKNRRAPGFLRHVQGVSADDDD